MEEFLTNVFQSGNITAYYNSSWTATGYAP